jgi:hypothetical protein
MYIGLQTHRPGVRVSDESSSGFQRQGEPPRVVTDPGLSVHRAPPAAVPAPTADGLNSSATRYLSAGAYLDANFREETLVSVLDQDNTAVAPSYSINIVPILKHCLAAAQQQRFADRMVAGVVLVCLAISFRQFVFAAATVYGVLSGLRAMAGITTRRLGSALLYALLALILLSIAVISADSALGQTEFADSGAISSGFGRLVLTLLLAVAGAAAVLTWHQVTIHRTLLENFTEGNFRPGYAPLAPRKYIRRLDYLSNAQHGNVTIYGQARRQNPFLGCGPVKEAWSLALPLTPDPDQDRTPVPLSVGGLYKSMRVALVTLANPQDGEEQRIKGLSLQQRIFVSGLLPRGHTLIDEHRHPRLDISQAEMNALSNDERSRSTQLLTVRVNGWDGELDVTVLLYFSVRGNMLYIEFTACSLAPIAAKYHEIDTLEEMGQSVYLRAGLVSLLSAPSALLRCPLDVVHPMIAGVQRNLDVRGQLQRIASQVSFDYGATSSVRELGADQDASNLFHQYDSERYIKIVNRRVIDAIAEVLEEHGYSNEDFVRRANYYIDRSTNIHDSNNIALAMGTNARADNRSQQPPPTTGAGK